MELRSARCLRHGLLTSTALAGLGILPAAAGQLPTGYSTSFGSVGFTRSSGTLTINQSSQSAIVNYNSFSIGRHNRVQIRQPNASSTLLDRVTGTTKSVIAGRLTANGQVYLINPNGIAITKSGVVKVGGGFVASSLGMTDDEFKNGRSHFAGGGGRVSNRGTITIGRGGYAALLGGKVMNGGTIAVPMGTVALGAGEMATLDVSGDGFLQVALPSTASGKGALITNAGRIAGVTVMVDAATARAAARNVVNISGTIDSHTISGQSGSIQIGGTGGTVGVSGHLSVASRQGTGGTVTITGDQVALHHAHVTARGATGGGSIRIGGDFHGGGTLAHAGTVTIDKKSVIRADATTTGDGGSVVVWSDETTHFAGLISAKGGAQGGDGGQAEVSSHGTLAYTGKAVLTAAKGAMGTLLLDPYDVVITSGTDSNTATSSNGGTTTYTPSGTSVISNTEIETQLATANVTITTGAAGSAGSNAGNITVNAPVTWASGSLLTLTAANAIAINAPISITGAGKLALNAATATVGAASLPQISFGTGGNVTFATGQTGQALSINGAGYTLVTTVAQLQAVGSTGNYALAQNLDATGVTGFTPIGESTPFTGTFTGLGHTISNLTISGQFYDGLFGQVGSGGVVESTGLVGGSVTGDAYVGGLAGSNAGTITQTYATSTVTVTASNGNAGGLVGFNGDFSGNGTITQSYATGMVGGSQTSTYDTNGGLVGYNAGTIMQSYATGGVTGSGSSYIGGLVGYNNTGKISEAYATGAVASGSGHVGGLIGENYSGPVTNSYYDTQTAGVGNNGSGTGVSTQVLASATTLAALNSAGTVWGNAGNQTTPYLLNNVGPVYLGSDTSTTPTSYTPVLSLAGLQAIGSTGNYVLAQNLDATGVTGFTPIGESTPFTGTFTGLGHTISNLTISSTATYVGLFGQVGGGTVERVGLVGGAVSGTYSNTSTMPSGQYVGGLIGQNNGTVTQSYSTAAVSGTIGSGGKQSVQYLGGLIGQNSGTVTQSYAAAAVGGTISGINNEDAGQVIGGLVGDNYGTITQSYATAAVGGTISGTGTSNPNQTLGGLVGINEGAFDSPAGSILQSYATGAVSASSDSDAGVTSGGLVGSNRGGLYAAGGQITQSYATGAVRASSSDPNYFGYSGTLGGLVGDNEGALFGGSGGAIAQSYATGAVSGSGTLGGLVGFSGSGFLGGGGPTITASYYDAQTTGQGGSGTAVSTQALANATTLAALNSVGTVWGNAGNQTTPYLLANPGPVILATDTASAATSTTPTYYTPVLSLSGLQAVNANLAGNYVLANNIDASGTTFTTGVIAGGDASGNLPTPFSGMLEGLGHTVSNLTIAGGSNDYVGLIGYSTGTVRDIGVSGGTVGGTDYVGGLVGENNNGTIVQSYATSTVSGLLGVGGLAGYSTGTVTGSYATGTVSGSSNTGGLVGENDGKIGQSSASGSVTAMGAGSGNFQNVGGLVGYNYSTATISQSYATGAVNDSSGTAKNFYFGGLVGQNGGGINESYATGNVTVTGTGQNVVVGGLVGTNTGTIGLSYATGSVVATATGTGQNVFVGGLVGDPTGPRRPSVRSTRPARQRPPRRPRARTPSTSPAASSATTPRPSRRPTPRAP